MPLRPCFTSSCFVHLVLYTPWLFPSSPLHNYTRFFLIRYATYRPCKPVIGSHQRQCDLHLRVDRSGYEGLGLSGLRGSPAAYERARLSYTDDIFYEDVHSTSWHSGEGKAEVDDERGGGTRSDDDSGSLTSVD